MNKIVITGGLGHIGSFITSEILKIKKNLHVVIIDSLYSQRYPSLCSPVNKTQNFEGWDCSFGPFGIPLRLEQISGILPKDPMIKVLSFDTALQEKPCRRLIERKGSQLVPSKQLKTYLELIFNLKID